MKYSNELKKQAVEEYLSGGRQGEVVQKYGLSDKSRLGSWVKQYREFGCFPDGRGKATGAGKGRPKKVDPTQMSKDEYIKYLEMENDILKQLRSLNNNQQN